MEIDGCGAKPCGLKLTVSRYYTPSGRSIQNQGITPDVFVDANAPPRGRPRRGEPAREELRAPPAQRAGRRGPAAQAPVRPPAAGGAGVPAVLGGVPEAVGQEELADSAPPDSATGRPGWMCRRRDAHGQQGRTLDVRLRPAGGRRADPGRARQREAGVDRRQLRGQEPGPMPARASHPGGPDVSRRRRGREPPGQPGPVRLADPGRDRAHGAAGGGHVDHRPGGPAGEQRSGRPGARRDRTARRPTRARGRCGPRTWRRSRRRCG